MHLALYCFANGQLSTALRLLYRARYLMLVVSGEDHPEMALLDVSEIFCRTGRILKILSFFSGKEPVESIWKGDSNLEGDWMNLLFVRLFTINLDR